MGSVTANVTLTKNMTTRISNVPVEVWTEMHLLQSAMADLTRALLTNDTNYIVGDLRKIAYHRNKLVNELQTWQPELRISAPCDD